MNRNSLAALAAVAVLMSGPALRAVPLATVGDTKFDLYGFVWLYGNYYVDAKEQQNGWAGSLFYNYTTTTSPLDTHLLPDHQFVMAAQPTRFGFMSTTPNTSLGDVVTDIEYDLNSSSGINLRQAMVNVGDWYLGQTWTLWCDPNSYAETVDWCGPVGQPSFLAPRPYVMKYIHKSGKETFGASLEQQTTINSGEAGATGTGDQRWPTMVLGWSHKDAWGHIALHAMGQYFGTFVPATATAAKKHYGREECAFMVSGDFRITPADDFLYSFYEGDALGGYGIGFQSVYFNDTTRVVTPFRSLGWVAAYQHTWSPKYRSNVNVSGLEYKQPDLPSAYLPYYYYLRSGMSAFANTFIFFNKNVDMGFEYGFEQATPTRYFYAVNSDDHKVSHNTNRKVEVSLRARF